MAIGNAGGGVQGTIETQGTFQNGACQVLTCAFAATVELDVDGIEFGGLRKV